MIEKFYTVREKLERFLKKKLFSMGPLNDIELRPVILLINCHRANFHEGCTGFPQP